MGKPIFSSCNQMTVSVKDKEYNVRTIEALTAWNAIVSDDNMV